MTITTLQIVALKQELGRAALDGSWTTEQEALNTACNMAMSSTFESADREEARQTIADYLNAKSGADLHTEHNARNAAVRK